MILLAVVFQAVVHDRISTHLDGMIHKGVTRLQLRHLKALSVGVGRNFPFIGSRFATRRWGIYGALNNIVVSATGYKDSASEGEQKG